MAETAIPEPWLSGTLGEVSAVPRAVLHALELAKIDLTHWCGARAWRATGLTNHELNLHQEGIASIAFHLRHIARSVDRLLTYAEERSLDPAQIAALKTEAQEGATHDELFAELDASLARAASRIRALDENRLNETRSVGSKKLPTTLGGLLVHIADHTQRHVGQAVTTAKFIRALRAETRE